MSLPGVDSLEAIIDSLVESSSPGVDGISFIILLVSFSFVRYSYYRTRTDMNGGT